MRQAAEIAIVGHACRLPGANSMGALWAMLREGRCAVTRIPPDRWSLERFGHPRQSERGRSYTWAAGVLDEIWSFDPAAFGMSPREAEQMDPQQRLLLELTWEALEDAGIRPSSLAGTEVGVFVGASTTDHGNSKMFDVAATDGYFATGNAASILSNRISYIYDLNGPSFTVDTACSSSLVALDAAVQAIRAGRIDTAIVGGVSILTTPFQFVNFSQASMLSRIGLCQAFSAKADGYVRSEGGGVVVLRAMAAVGPADRVHATVVATRVNSDGRTNGIALPSTKRQAQLLEQLYGREDIDPDRLAFVEAHGTGTPVGDPVEAGALGEVLGRRRGAPLPIGSVKSNIGHTEAAAGLAGLLKAVLALENDLLPSSLHCAELNPHIDFAGLNLAVASESLPLARGEGPRLAGISSYGFGGTNGHAVIGDAPPRDRLAAPAPAPAVLMLSARSRGALAALASAYAERIAPLPEAGIAALAAAANHRRDRLEERLVVPLAAAGSLAATLQAYAEGRLEAAPTALAATAVGRDVPVAFVYAGNGGQWAGMGRAAYAASAAFRAGFDAVDTTFRALAGWSLADALHADDLAARLGKTSVAQPLIYAIQSATTAALAAYGLRPAVVLGHSVGEVAAAAAAGVLDERAATRLIYYRSLHQETVHRAGGMTVLIGNAEAAAALTGDGSGLAIAAYNSPRAFTLSGSVEAVAGAAAAARRLKVRTQKLDIAYPFHSALIDPIEEPLRRDLAGLAPAPGHTPFVSAVTGTEVPGAALDAGYWWRNVREPVLFAKAVREAARLGARLFVEIGPSPILLSHIADTMADGEAEVATLSVLDRKGGEGDPFLVAAAMAAAKGAALDGGLFGGDGPGADDLPHYPWQRKSFRLADTTESIGFLTPRGWHPLVGARYAPDSLEWHGQIDTALLPALADHVVDGHILLPGSAFVEMVLEVGREWHGTDAAAVADFEIHNPMILVAGASRDVRCRVQPATGTVEVMSRARLGPAAWQTHAVAKIIHPSAAPARLAKPPGTAAGMPALSSAELYPLAAASGLDYGPGFRLLRTAVRPEDALIVVELEPDAGGGARFGLDPMRLDACFHGLAFLYRDLAVGGRLKPYVPVAAGEIALDRPGVPIVRAELRVARSDARTIIVGLTLLGADDRPVARLHRMRFQAMSAFRSGERAVEPIVRALALAAEPLAIAEGPSITATDAVAAARAAGGVAEGEEPTPGDYVLLDGWATATAFGLFEVLAEDGRVDLDRLQQTGRLPQRLVPWSARLLAALDQSGLVHSPDGGRVWTLSGAELPDPHDILRALAADHPERSAELLLAARTGALVDALAAGRIDGQVPVSATAIEAFDYGGAAARSSAAVLAATLDQLAAAAWPMGRAVRLLQVGDGPLTALAVRLVTGRGAELTVVEPDRRRLERARLAFEGHEGVAFESALDRLAPASVDLVIASQALHRIVGRRAAWADLAAAMAPGAVLAAIEPEASVFRDLVFGLHAAMTADAEADGAAPPPDNHAAWTRVLDAMDLSGAVVLPTAGTDYGLLCIGQKAVGRQARAFKGEALIIGEGAAVREATGALATMLRFSGLKATSVTADEFCAEPPAVLPDTLVYLAATAETAAAAALGERVFALKRLAGAIGSRKTTLWLVAPGAIRDGDGASPVEAGLWSFARTLANEVPTVDVRLVDLLPGLAADVAARRLRDVVLSGTAETDIVVDASRTEVVRYRKMPVQGAAAIPAAETAIRLVKADGSGGLDRLRWTPEPRRPPGPGELELAVDAAGLNFRDVMWGLSILPEEILEDGYAGATLGLECAGRVVRVGPAVEGFAVGDPVLAFAKAALSTHVTVAAQVVAHCPETLSMDAAATVPVAFLTTYYGLIRCARLAEDEWVLIHGGAGGVGLAAMQMARWRGARIVATAGSPERRDLLVSLGADHVFDSRSHRFVDDIRRVTGEGVDVVLNSLSGEAMERSIAVLKPFGRFVELGKRDYVANTHIGLKPFRRNLAYYGVDLDQLILRDDRTGRALFEEVMGLFADGALQPLPYRPFAADEAVEAFRIMQRSGHIGKIVIRPPAIAAAAPVPAPFAADPAGVHLVTGGFGGFGLATARWLADHGARHIMLVGRSGADAAAAAAIDALERDGVTVLSERLDITDEPAVYRLFARFGASLPPLAGISHAAAVIEDAILANLERDKVARVLGAKAAGAAILDRASRDHRPGYFILFSSATTVIGNPGQGAYVAANAFLEGLARARRAAGLPALAVAWGAIEDVGILTRSGAAAVNLLARSGVTGMTARGGLDRLAAILPQAQADPGCAVVTLAAVNWATAREHLPVLRSKSFAPLMQGLTSTDTAGKAKIKVKALVEKEGVAAASHAVAEIVLDEIARILRLPKDDISRTKPLMDTGLDSLMAVELGMGLEERFELEAPLSTSAGAMTVAELADYIVGANAEPGGRDQTSEDLAVRHLDAAARREIVEALPTLGEGTADAARSGLLH